MIEEQHRLSDTEGKTSAKEQRKRMACFISTSWRLISHETIVNTFRHIGIGY
jgi:hypothetical protein